MKKGVQKKLRKPWKYLGLLVLGLFLLGVIYFSFLSITLPPIAGWNFQQFKKAAQKAKESAIKRDPFYEWIALPEVHEDFLHALLAGEDAKFFAHEGMDLGAIKDALFENIKRKRYARGGSTITQQVAKNVFLSSEKTLRRKFKEAILVKRIEKTLNKKQILEIYVNIIPFGPKLIGVSSASYHFFGKPPSQINAGEGAYLSLFLPSPDRSYKAIYQKLELSSSQRKKYHRIIKNLFQEKKISEDQYELYSDLDYILILPSLNSVY